MERLTTSGVESLLTAEDPATPGVDAEEPVFVIRDEPPPRPRRRAVVGWVVTSVVLVLAVWVVTQGVVASVRASRRVACLENLKRLGLAFHEYHEKNGHFPAPAVTGKGGAPLLSWRVELLPHLGQQALYDAFHKDEPWDSPHNLALVSQMPPVFDCRSASGRDSGRTGYRVVVGPKTELGSVNTMFEPGRGVDLREVTDGTSNTVMVVESRDLVPWTKPDEFRWAPGQPLPGFGSGHPEGFHALLVDGSVKFFKTTMRQDLLGWLLTTNGGEVLSDD